MTITDEIKKLLTIEVLGECWHERRTEDVGKKPWDLSHCVKCGELVKLQSFDRRTFDNRNDLLDLYEAIYMDEVNIWKWREFCDLSASKDYFYVDSLSDDYAEWTEWLFCLDGKGHEDRCKMVSEFYGFREE